jgi:hypothetical protein
VKSNSVVGVLSATMAGLLMHTVLAGWQPSVGWLLPVKAESTG